MAKNIMSQEPCTLVYTLLDPTIISYDDFELIIRSLHKYLVESITPNREMQNVHVKLGYQASIVNIKSKLGLLRDAIGVIKLSSFIKECEISKLEQLRQQFGLFGGENDESRPQRPYKPRGRCATFARPYARKGVSKPVPTSSSHPTVTFEEENAQPFPSSQQQDEIANFYIGDNSEN